MKVKKFQPVLALKPTQFAIGVVEAEYKVLELKKLKAKKLQDCLESKPVPVVLSPWKDLYVIDHHHFLFACWHANIPKVKVEVIRDFSDQSLSYHQFWKKLSAEGFAYLYDQFGEGPRDPLYLPMDIRGLADDPYRSLAWIVRKEGGMNNCEEPFSEFQWANFFRERKLLASHGRQGMQEAVKKGLKLAVSKEASHLPGFRQVEPKKVLKKIKPESKFIPKAQSDGPLAAVPLVK